MKKLNLIAGVDEVGRGCLAGPVTAAAVILPKDIYIPKLNDSKKLTENQRNKLRKEIELKAIAFSVEHVMQDEIDKINILNASIKAMHKALRKLCVSPKFIAVDGNQFIKDAINNGARTIISNGKFQGLKGKVLFLKKKNIRKTLSELVHKLYKKKPKNLIAVTGTNGKSSIADFYLQILSLNKKKAASIGTLGIKTFAKNIEVTNTTLDPIKLGYFLIINKEKYDGCSILIFSALKL